MASLSDRLKALGVRVGEAGISNLAKPRHPIETVIEGELRETNQGEVFVVEETYRLEYAHGNGKIALSTSLDIIAAYAGEEKIAKAKPDELVFLDTETTGLAGGGGTYAFMVGAGRFEGDIFRLAQFFMRDPGHEQALLLAVEEFVAPCHTLVTFNGKSFDAPLLETRYITNRLPSPLKAMAHFDLLHLSRRVWRERLPDRSLGYLEQHILGETRIEEDVPGWMIPGLYLDFVRSGDARPLRGVFYHNLMDILTMVALTGRLAEMLVDPLGSAIQHAEDLLSIGYLFEDLDLHDRAVQIIEESLNRELPAQAYARALERLAHLHRRRGDRESALSLWWQAAADRHIYAHVELAKHYEHQENNFAEALRWTEAALAILNASGVPRYEKLQWEGELQHRKKRLEDKLAKTNSGD
jgi:hypothetical protein